MEFAANFPKPSATGLMIEYHLLMYFRYSELKLRDLNINLSLTAYHQLVCVFSRIYLDSKNSRKI